MPGLGALTCGLTRRVIIQARRGFFNPVEANKRGSPRPERPVQAEVHPL